MHWFYVSLTAVAFQSARHALQRHFSGQLGITAIAWSRTFFMAPIIVFLVTILKSEQYAIAPNFPLKFHMLCAIAGVAQMAGTFGVVKLFAERNFSVGVAFTKTETIQVAIMGCLFLGEPLPTKGIIAVSICASSIPLFFLPQERHMEMGLIRRIAKMALERTIVLGVFTGLCFALTSILLKKAIKINTQEFSILTSVTVLLTYMLYQTIACAIYLAFNRGLKSNLIAILSNWKKCSSIGLTSILGTLCWIMAYGMQKIAYVAIISQSEIIISILISIIIFKEKANTKEITGIALLLSGVIITLT